MPQEPQRRKLEARATAMVLAGVCLAVAVRALPVRGQQAPSESADFVRDIRVPGQGEAITRPSALFFDRVHGELLVADPGHDRIVIFSAAGAFKFAFGLADAMTIPVDVVADPEGYIYVLGSSPEGRALMRFDFDGLALGPVPVPGRISDRDVSLTGLACDDQGVLYGLDEKGLRILRLGQDTPRVVCDLEPLLQDNTTGVFGLGDLIWDRGEFLLPVATSGFVMRLSTAGEFLGTVGHGGAKPGALAFPVAVARTPDGAFLVLDKNRFCVVCYGQDGVFRGEFGGKGFSRGWFVNPSLLALTGPETIVVGQIFANRIQMLRLPAFMHVKTSGAAMLFPDREPVSRGGRAAPLTGDPSKRRSADIQLRLSTCGDEIGPHNLASVSPSEASS